MSGRKYTYIDTSELANLRRDAGKLRSLREDLPERIENAVRQTQQDIDRRLTPIEDRQREYSRAISGLSSDIRQVEHAAAQRIADQAVQTRKAIKDTSEKIENQRRELRVEIHETAKKITDANAESEKRLIEQIHETERHLGQIDHDLRDQINQQEERLNQAIEKERIERQGAIQAVNQKIIAMHEDRSKLRTLAIAHLHDAEIIRDFIKDHYQHNHFAPNQLASLDSAMASAQRTLNQGGSEAALAQANIVTQNLSELRMELEKLETEWRIQREMALQTAKRILGEVQSNRSVAGIVTQGEVAEVDFWTEGKLSAFEAEIRALMEKAENEDHPMTLEGMRDLVDQVLPVMDKRLEKILDEAQTNAIRSQVRVSACDLAGQVLDGTMDYTPAGGLYEGEDMRNGFVSVWRNLAGSEVIVTVEPEGDHEKMTIDSFEASPVSPEERLQRSHDIAQLMRECGLQVEDPKEESALPSEKNRDLEEVRKRQVARGKAAAKEVKR